MKALIIVDMQSDFMPGGSLAVPRGDEIIPTINKLVAEFPLVVATQDWHPKDHKSFAENHEGKSPGDQMNMEGIDQILWPAHCVQNTPGAALVFSLKQDTISQIFYKGTDIRVDSYSAFFDNARRKSTGLDEYLKKAGVRELYFVGVATDYCVLFSVLDALELGFDVHVVRDGCKAINLQPEDEKKAFRLMEEKGADIVESTEVLGGDTTRSY